jgi:hypothetical protein
VGAHRDRLVGDGVGDGVGEDLCGVARVDVQREGGVDDEVGSRFNAVRISSCTTSANNRPHLRDRRPDQNRLIAGPDTGLSHAMRERHHRTRSR